MRTVEDRFTHKGLRRKMVEALRTEHHIHDERVLTVMENIPRHFLLDSAFDHIAYQADRAFPIPAGQTISRPSTVAFQTQLLEVKPNEKILEIGTGSTYQATILAALGARVYTIERQKELYLWQQEMYPFKKEYPGIRFFYGDGFKGLVSYAPFDKIIVTAAAPFIPQELVKQMKPGARMVIPLNDAADETKQTMLRLTLEADGTLTEERFHEVSFVPMLSGRNHV